MKIALLITCQLRTYTLCKSNIKSLIIDNYDADVYLSIDRSNALQVDNANPVDPTQDAAIADALAFFKPVDHVICESYEAPSVPAHFKNILEQYYVVQQAYGLLTKHTEKTGKVYDVVIRTRFDTILCPKNIELPRDILVRHNFIKYNSISIQKIDELSRTCEISVPIPGKHELYVPNYESSGAWVDDHFWIHAADMSAVMASYYDSLPVLVTGDIDLNNSPWYEVLFKRFLSQHGIHPQKIDFRVVFCRANHT